MTRIQISEVTSVSLAGGGNRCWWQAGVLEVWQHSGRLAAKRFAGTSAGAGVAAATLCGNLVQAIEACRAAYARNPSLWLGKRNAWFAQEEIYPAWVSSFVTDEGLVRMRASHAELIVGICRLPSYLPNWLGIGFGMAAYLIDKYGASALHPRLASRLGLKLELHSLHAALDTAQAMHLLVCAAAAPPFIATRWLQTRFYPKLPQSFYFEGRNYLQPSRKIPVSTWDCTASADIMAAVELGRKDGVVALNGFAVPNPSFIQK
jgi:Patatin-like phospholipase